MLDVSIIPAVCLVECEPVEAVMCDEGLLCQPGTVGYTCGELYLLSFSLFCVPGESVYSVPTVPDIFGFNANTGGAV